MTRSVHDFLAWVPPAAAEGSSAEFRRLTGVDPTLRLEGPDHVVLVSVGAHVSIGRDSTERTTLLLFGDVVEAGSDPATELAARYAARGESFARDVHGSWTALVVDELRGRVMAFTDRLSSRRLFHAGGPEAGHWLSPSLRHIPTEGRALDAVGVAWFLSNGAIHCGHTPFSGVTVLEAGSVHELTDSGLGSRRYWQYPFPPDREGGDERAAGSELLERLEAGVQRCATGPADLWLSLSGGYDSRTIATMLRNVGAVDVECFSYAHGPAREGTDAWVARQIATSVGFAHRTIESYGGDLVGHVRLNARMGQGVSPVCDEIDGWREVGRIAEGDARPTLLVGDHFLPDRPEAGPALDKKYPPGKMRPFEVAAWLEPHLPSEVYRSFVEGVRDDVASLHAQVAHAPTRIDNLIYLEQRLPNVVLAWRHAFAGPSFNVRTPFLDNDVMDFLATLPGPVLRSRFYHDAVRRAYPQAFQIPLAETAGYYPPLKTELARNANACRALIRETPSRLDELLPPALGLWLVDRVAASRALDTRLKGRLSRWLRRSRPTTEGAAAPGAVGEHLLLRRYLVLREALARRSRGVERSPEA